MISSSRRQELGCWSGCHKWVGSIELLGCRKSSFSSSIDIAQVDRTLWVDSTDKESSKFLRIESGGLESRQRQPGYAHLTGVGPRGMGIAWIGEQRAFEHEIDSVRVRIF